MTIGNKEKRLAILLMISTMVLLLSFFSFWLVQTYKKQKELLSRELFFLYSEGFHIQQDSLFTAMMRMKWADTLPTILLSNKVELNTNVKLEPVKDRTQGVQFKIIQTAQSTPVVESKDTVIYFQINADSSRSMRLGRRMGRGHELMYKRHLERARLMGLEDDTIYMDSAKLTKSFEKGLKEARLNLKPYVKTVSYDEMAFGYKKSLEIGPFPASYPADFAYIIGVHNASWVLTKKIIPEILISLFLTSLLAITFWIIWKNIQEQTRLNLIQSEFVSNITHELKTPISTVSVALEAIQHFNVLSDKEKTIQYLNIAGSEVSRLNLLVDNILKNSLFQQGGLSLQTEPIALDSLFETIRKAMHIPLESKGITFSTKFEHEPITIQGDLTHMTNVFVNLVDNAIKYTHKGDEISIKVSKQGNSIEIRVIDNGPGVAYEYQSRLFERFFRVPTNDKHNVKGHGLGLSYVQDVIQKHHGTISYQPNQPRGSVFIIKLPA